MTDITLMISSGSGPRECQYAARGIAKAFIKEAKIENVKASLLETDSSASYLLRLSGHNANSFAKARCGTIRWIGQSPYRKNHKRKNWFVGVSILPELTDMPDIKETDIQYMATRASGPGGQHVNKTNSAVRAVHVPTGISVTAQEERSQHANKKLCRLKLTAIFAQRNALAKHNAKTAQWSAHKSLERGNEVRVYHGEKFKS